ncbi:MAG: hypothetical protein FWE21_00615 [Defluviitaleaceae bacterium]|nr:hypothetical protein [Defluviitaleaceae bacterium]
MLTYKIFEVVAETQPKIFETFEVLAKSPKGARFISYKQHNIQPDDILRIKEMRAVNINIEEILDAVRQHCQPLEVQFMEMTFSEMAEGD